MQLNIFNKTKRLNLTNFSKDEAISKVADEVVDLFVELSKKKYQTNKEMLPDLVDKFVGHKYNNAKARFLQSNYFILCPPYMHPQLLIACAVEPILVAYNIPLKQGDRDVIMRISEDRYNNHMTLNPTHQI